MVEFGLVEFGLVELGFLHDRKCTMDRHKKIDLVWFGCPGLYRFALDYFGLLCFGLESVWNPAYHEPWTDKKEKKKKKNI